MQRVVWGVSVLAIVACSPRLSPVTTNAGGANTLALMHATIYPSPTDPPISNGAAIVRNGKIVAVEASDEIALPAGATVLDATGLFLVAGFQNSHVHFTEAKWNNARNLPPPSSRST